MATTPVRMLLPPGLGTLTLRLYPIDGDEDDHESSVAESSVPGRWTWSVTEAITGDYEAVVANADDNVVAGGRVRLADTEGLHWIDAAASQSSVDGVAASVDGIAGRIASAGGVEVVSPVMGGGRIVVTRGFDYADDGGSQSIVISETEPGAWGDDLLTADSFRLYARHDTERKIDFDVESVTLSETDGLHSFSFDLLRDAAPRSGAYTYWVYGRWEPAERETPVIRGTIVIERGRIVATP